VVSRGLSLWHEVGWETHGGNPQGGKLDSGQEVTGKQDTSTPPRGRKLPGGKGKEKDDGNDE